MSDQCINPNLQHRIMLQIMKAGKDGVAPILDPELNKHLENCSYCASMLPALVSQSAGMKRLTEENDLLERGALGDPSVLVRIVKEGKAFFKLADSENGLGLMVIVGDFSRYDIRRVERITRTQFEGWE